MLYIALYFLQWGEVKENGHDHLWSGRSVGVFLGYVVAATNDILSQQSIDRHLGWGSGGRFGAGSPSEKEAALAAPFSFTVRLLRSDTL